MLTQSTGSKIKVLDSGFKPTYTDCIIAIFSGEPPASPDDAIAATNILVALAAVDPAQWTAGTVGAFGVDWEDADAQGIMRPLASDTIISIGQTSGAARWFWIIENVTDALNFAASTTLARVQGLAAVGTGDLKLSNTNFEAGKQGTADSIRIYF